MQWLGDFDFKQIIPPIDVKIYLSSQVIQLSLATRCAQMFGTSAKCGVINHPYPWWSNFRRRKFLFGALKNNYTAQYYAVCHNSPMP